MNDNQDDHSDHPQPPSAPPVEPHAAAPGQGIGLIRALVVAIPCILGVVACGVAIPGFGSAKLDKQRAELPTNLDGIRTAEKAYHAEWDTFTSVGPTPTSTPGRQAVNFEPNHAWNMLGWVADGKVRGKYQVTLVAGTSASTDNFNGSAVSDIDGDGIESSYTCNRAIKSKMRSANNVY